MNGYHVFLLLQNFILIKTKINSKLLQKKLLKKNILVRDCSTFCGLDENYIRIAVKNRVQNKLLVKGTWRNKMVKSLMIQGTSSGAGKTILVTALCRIFSDLGYTVSPFKAQNMSNFSYIGKNFEISRAQAIQAVAARTDIVPIQNPILLKPLGNYRSSVFVNGKFFKKMHANDYYENFVLKTGLKTSLDSFNKLSQSHEIIFLEGAGSPAEINLQKFDITNMKIAQKTKSPVLLITDIERGGAFASIVGTMELIEKKYLELVEGIYYKQISRRY